MAGCSLKDGFYVKRGVLVKRDRLTEACSAQREVDSSLFEVSGTMSI